MIKDAIVKCKTVTLTLVLLYKYIPIRDHLINSIKTAAKKLDVGIKVEVKHAEMNQEERAVFMAKARKFWKG